MATLTTAMYIANRSHERNAKEQSLIRKDFVSSELKTLTYFSRLHSDHERQSRRCQREEHLVEVAR